ncbi:hypothetical protein DNU06_12815 [Putridiphycobacter roseus]|uniref:Peptidyl-prolyl cis-trans isomerase n=1 Tax=Putridiphycobacter roseus TaxID=2219161 RepID=A0A2W1NED4_9FLAO|nr:FKBP-type peptidyl-prolyl cis-trans isomerase [Putridiphycobacter roseus]PZE16426.1 hypothetical protein DNU06_12815 [Putridiphycobacter roseus]
MKKTMLYAAVLLLASCGSKAEKLDYTPTDSDQEIATYLEDKEWEPVREKSGLYVYTEKEGGSEKPKASDFVTIFYKGYLLDGTVFDATEENPITYPLSGFIPGWKEGIPHFGKGGKGKIIVPPSLGYGSVDNGPIPANSVMIFDIELVDFNGAPPAPKLNNTADYSAEIKAYLAENNLKAKETESGLFIIIEEEGGKEKPTVNQFLTLNYEGYLMDGSSFDGTKGTPTTFPFPMTQLIKGWQEGIPYFGKGGKGKLIIPPYIGYGERGSAKIPANSILVFDIELIDFKD